MADQAENSTGLDGGLKVFIKLAIKSLLSHLGWLFILPLSRVSHGGLFVVKGSSH
jgi:hypothetical protein